ncbi:MAG: LptA/OstA family protein [Trueperaceae bacterium]
MKAARPALTLVAAIAVGWVFAQTATTFTLKRDDTELVITNRALASEGARSIGNNRNCEEGMRLTVVYGPAPGRVETQVEDSLLTSHLAIIRTPEGAEEGEGQETLELRDATVTFDRPGCPQEIVDADVPQVSLVQGRTTVTGTRFFLEREEDVGILDGPVRLVRAAEATDGAVGEDSARTDLVAEAEAMRFAVGEQRATLSGNVRVTSDERVTSGDTLELDEEAGTAVLTGAPARSTKGTDVIEGNRLLYYLDTDDVVVQGNVQGELEVELE